MYLTPIERYQQDLEQSKLVPDLAQKIAVKKIHRIRADLIIKQKNKQGIFGKLSSLLNYSTFIEPTKGVYFWGGVGRGKTYLMDLFYESLPFEKKMRVHFYRFMKHVHQELTRLDKKKIR